MLAREETIGSNYLKEDMTKVLPIVNQGGSDSAMLDNTLEFMVMNGMELPLAVMVTIPEPWENNHSMDPKKRAFYQYYATMLEPWDGPASILFSDGDVMGAVLDRNGLRPSRYYITKDGRLILSSEVGVLDIPAEEIVRKDRLRPGKMLLVDTARGELVDDESLKADYASREPYGEWLDRNLVSLAELKIPNERVPSHEHDELKRDSPSIGHSLQPSRLPCIKPCHMKSLGVMAMVSVMSWNIDAAVSASVPVVDAPAMPIFLLPCAFIHFTAVSTRSNG